MIKLQDPWNQTWSVCQICDKTYNNKKSLRVHVIQIHGLNYKEDYLAEYGDPEADNAKVCKHIIIKSKKSTIVIICLYSSGVVSCVAQQ